MYYFIDLSVIYQFLKEMELYDYALGLERYLNATQEEKDVILTETVKSIFKKFWHAGHDNYFVRDGVYYINIPNEKLDIKAYLAFELINGVIYVSVDDAKTANMQKNHEGIDEDVDTSQEEQVKPQERNSTSEEKQMIAKHIQFIISKFNNKLRIDFFAKSFYEVLKKHDMSDLCTTKVISATYEIYKKALKHFPSFAKLDKNDQLIIFKDAFPFGISSKETYKISQGVIYEFDKRGLLDKIICNHPVLRKPFEFTLEFVKRRSNGDKKLAKAYGSDDIVWASYGYDLGGKHEKHTFTLSAIRNVLNNYDGYDDYEYKDV